MMWLTNRSWNPRLALSFLAIVPLAAGCETVGNSKPEPLPRTGQSSAAPPSSAEEIVIGDGQPSAYPAAAGEDVEPHVRGKVLRTPSGGIITD